MKSNQMNDDILQHNMFGVINILNLMKQDIHSIHRFIILSGKLNMKNKVFVILCQLKTCYYSQETNSIH